MLLFWSAEIDYNDDSVAFTPIHIKKRRLSKEKKVEFVGLIDWKEGLNLNVGAMFQTLILTSSD